LILRDVADDEVFGGYGITVGGHARHAWKK
jgi:hypothetical protein